MTDRTRRREARLIAREVFGLSGSLTPLPGEFDLNFHLSGTGGDAVLKLSPQARRPILELVAASLEHVADARLSARVPRLVRPIRSARGGPRSGTSSASHPSRAPTRRSAPVSGPVVPVEFGGAPHVAAAVTYVEGIPYADLRPRSMRVLRGLGGLLAELDLALDGFDHPELDRDFAWRMEGAPSVIRSGLADVERGADGRDLVSATLDRALRRLDPVLNALPTCVIHNDANDYNVMVHPSLKGARLSGLIDFGDIVRGWRATEVAVAAAYGMMELADPFEAACEIAGGYASVTPLSEAECRAIIPLVALRLCLSVCIQAREMRRQPDNAYLAVSQKPARALLRTLARSDWRVAEFRIREACGLAPNPAAAAIPSMPDSAAAESVMFPEVLSLPHTIDLGVASLDLPHPDLLADARTGAGDAPAAAAASTAPEPPPRPLDRWVEDEIARAGATVGVGRYGEARLLYDDPAFHQTGNNGPEARTIHLGLDLFAPPGTPVRSPLPGTVVSAADNAHPRDYGPTVILRHTAADGTAFHTLFGHLDHPTLEHLAPGRQVGAGEVIGWLGDASVNGGWPPHLHFQVIALDPLYDDGTPASAHGNFPGVALQRTRTVWESVLPDPSALAGLPPSAETSVRPADRPVLRKRDLTQKRKTFLGSSLSLSYDDPIHMVRGLGANLYDDAARRYLDTVNNVPHVGHANLRVAEAIARHSRLLNTNTRYLHGEIVGLADELLAHFPAPLEVVFLVCSGSEANELALRMARCHTGSEGVVCLEGGYHGNTGGLVEVSHYKFAGPGGGGPGGRVAAAAMPDSYRGLYRRGQGHSDAELGALYAGEVARAVARLNSGQPAPSGEDGPDPRTSGDARPPGVAAFLAEPILSCGGQIEPPPGYLAAAFEHVRGAGGVCIADEVQVGFGRVGDAFWGFELQGVVPDIVTLGKPMGNGHPIAAVVTTREIADSFANGMEYFNTFGGNPVSCAAARAVLAEIRDRGLREQARRVGGALLDGLKRLGERHAIVGDARGRGLFLGIELVRDRESREPFPEACGYLTNRARELGVLLSVDGPDHNVIKIKPPLVFGEDEAALLLETLDSVLGETALAARPTRRK